MDFEVPMDVKHSLVLAADHCTQNPSKGDNAYALSHLRGIEEAVALDGENGFKTQILYILTNLGAWSGPAARSAKKILRKYAS